MNTPFNEFEVKPISTVHLRRALTTAETMIAMTLMGVAAASVGTFVSHVSQGLKDRELSARIGWEISNLRETIGSWNVAEITLERIQSVELSPAIRDQLDQPRWEVAVEDVQLGPDSQRRLDAIQISLTLAGIYRGQTVRPEHLTFWVIQEDDASEQASVDASQSGESQ